MNSFPAFILLLFSSSFKILLFPTYLSTDFEVHRFIYIYLGFVVFDKKNRNWLAITHSLPLKLWYFDNTSEWTLDYPPLFAYFEWCLSKVATKFDERITKRSTVIFGDILLWWAVYRFTSSTGLPRAAAVTVLVGIVVNAGLIIVDHIHFQYNGMLLGILLICFDFSNRGQFLLTAMAFSVLVLMKHLFFPLAPVFAIHLIQHYCLQIPYDQFQATRRPNTLPKLSSSTSSRSRFFQPIIRFLHLVSIALIIVSIAFGPFLLQENPGEQLNQIFSRLFPFKRGLVHAYWAPNFWALYTFLDKILYFIFKKLQIVSLPMKTIPTASSGLVGDFPTAVLPHIHPVFTIIIVILSQIPAYVSLIRKPSDPSHFILVVTYCALSSFMFGYHVHEKAILVPIVTLALLVTGSKKDVNRLHMQLASVGIYCLFPLLTRPQELAIKALLLVCYMSMMAQLTGYNMKDLRFRMALLSCLFVFCEFMHPLVFRSSNGELSWPFLPLMFTSVICSILVTKDWVEILLLIL